MEFLGCACWGQGSQKERGRSKCEDSIHPEPLKGIRFAPSVTQDSQPSSYTLGHMAGSGEGAPHLLGVTQGPAVLVTRWCEAPGGICKGGHLLVQGEL